MTTRQRARRKDPLTGRYYPNTVPLSAIRRYARAIADKFDVERVILFGSKAYGTPTPDSDVDIRVVMRAANEVSKANRIGAAVTLSSKGLKRAGGGTPNMTEAPLSDRINRMYRMAVVILL
jgi:predicted nucleotidyltransferase